MINTTLLVREKMALVEAKKLTPSQDVNADVRASWERMVCAGMRPNDKLIYEVDLAYDIKMAQEKYSLLRHATHTGLLAVKEELVDPQNNVFILSDTDNHCIESFGLSHGHSQLLRGSGRSGVHFDEARIGTAAMNLALHTGRLARTFGAEHYFFTNHALLCMAVPLHDGRGDVVGVLNWSRDKSVHDALVAGTLQRAAGEIEQHLFIHQARQQRHTVLEIALRPGETPTLLIAIDANGFLTAGNTAARHYLDLWQFPPTPPTPVDTVFGIPAAALLAVSDTHYQPLVSQHSGRTFWVKAHAPVLSATRIHIVEHRAPKAEPSAGQKALNRSIRALNAGLSVLLQGETGTGKEYTARHLHDCSTASRGPFIAVNCASLPESMIEAELFGYVDGAFTGAKKGGMAGRLEDANGGTLFLDEIGDMPLALQSRLLRVLDRHEVVRVGSSKPISLHIQVISATHCNLPQLLAEKRFRQDLYYRLAGFSLTLSPLRQREDRQSLLTTLAATRLPNRVLDGSAWARLVDYPWPGNVRQAISLMTQIAAFSEEGETIDADWINALLPPPVAATPAITTDNNGQHGTLEELERQAIAAALKQHAGNITHTAEQLAINRATLQRKIKRYGFK